MAGRTATHRTVAGAAAPAPLPGVARATRALGKPLGDECYLWIIVALELVATVILRSHFRGAHGG